MRVTDNGSFYGVSISRAEVEAFNEQWPCSELPDKAIWFQFDKRSGDLVDTTVDEAHDGSAALALSEDAQACGAKKLGLT